MRNGGGGSLLTQALGTPNIPVSGIASNQEHQLQRGFQAVRQPNTMPQFYDDEPYESNAMRLKNLFATPKLPSQVDFNIGPKMLNVF